MSQNTLNSRKRDRRKPISEIVAPVCDSAARVGGEPLRDRIERLLAREITFVDHPSFREAQERASAFDPGPTRLESPPEGAPAYFAQLYRTPLLSAEQEREHFRRMNYLKYRANMLRSRLDPARSRRALVERIEGLLAEARRVRDRIVEANLRLVVSIARRIAGRSADFEELLGDGNIVLLNAVEKFDFGRGFRFSTYATHAIQRELYRRNDRSRKERSRFIVGADGLIGDAVDEVASEPEQREHIERCRRLATLLHEHLPERERRVIALRFGLDDSGGPSTLQEIGVALGVSKERIRQLESKAIETLRRAAEESRGPLGEKLDARDEPDDRTGR